MIEWNVIIENINRRQITAYNVFNHHSFKNDCIKFAKECNDRETFSSNIERSIFYYFGSKCEWEVVISGFPPSENVPKSKIDVRHQLQLNFDRFIDYLWSNRKEIAAWSIT